MKKNTLLRTNLLVCTIIVVGFIVTAVISYRSNWNVFEKDVERVSTLTSEGISHQIDSIFTRPINVSLTMANDSLLKDFLSKEQENLKDQTFIQTMRSYLDAYREKYNYDSVFLVSTQTNRYYHFNGLDRTLDEDNSENIWYYTFLKENTEYSLNIDNDEASNDEITAFINARIVGPDGEIMGVVGVGFRVDTLQALLREYENDFDITAHLISPDGTIEIATDKTGYQMENLFDRCAYPQLRDDIVSSRESAQDFWYSSPEGRGYLVTQYIPSLEWLLLIDHDTSTLDSQFTGQFICSILVVVLVIALVLVTITSIIRKYNAQLIKLTVARTQEHNNVLQEATGRLYENIYELDVTHNCAASEATEEYFASLGIPPTTSYSEALLIIAQKQIKEEYRQGYLTTFAPENVLGAFHNGVDTLRYEFLTSNDGLTYYWMRIIGHIFYWKEDDSVRLLIYRQNIDEEKQRESRLLEQMQHDSLTGLYNKAATQEHIHSRLTENPNGCFAFFILDIDNFKQVNDRFGHAAGDAVLSEFARLIQQQFQHTDIVGRIGGDEFVAFFPIAENADTEQKAQTLTTTMQRSIATSAGPIDISISLGVALVPEAGQDFGTLYRNADYALYRTKKNGKAGFSVFSKS